MLERAGAELLEGAAVGSGRFVAAQSGVGTAMTHGPIVKDEMR